MHVTNYITGHTVFNVYGYQTLFLDEVFEGSQNDFPHIPSILSSITLTMEVL
jgi:hypothetical protein